MASAHYRNRIAAFYQTPQPASANHLGRAASSSSRSAIRRSGLRIAEVHRRWAEKLDGESTPAGNRKLIVAATLVFAAGVATIVGALPSLIHAGAAALTAWAGLSPGRALVLAASGFLFLGVCAVLGAVLRITTAVQQSHQAVEDIRWRILFLEESIRRLDRTRPEDH